MGFFITKRTDAPTTRLQSLARAVRWVGGYMLTGAALLGVSSLLALLMNQGMDVKKLPISAGVVLFGLTIYRIGHAIARRNRWGVYAGICVLSVPILMRFLPMTNVRSSSLGFVAAMAGIGVIARVWRKLAPMADDEVEDEEEEQPITPRNRGFGEGRLNAARQRELPSGQGIGHPMEEVPVSKAEPELVRVREADQDL